jgi:hypothetical protein
MSAAASSARTQVRPNPAARQPVSQTPAHAAQGFSFTADDQADEIRIHVADLPHIEETLIVEGFKPTLMSRLFDLFAPLNKR